jgi:DNA-binding HxlR family transcriptional regulator
MNKANAAQLSDSISICVAEGDQAAREFLTRIGDKWSILVVAMLSKAPGRRSRFMGLKNSVGGISQTMLTATLRNLERDGMVVREIFPEVPPRVEYELTKLGLSMLEPMQGLIDWVAANWATVKKARERFDSKLK